MRCHPTRNSSREYSIVVYVVVDLHCIVVYVVVDLMITITRTYFNWGGL